MGWGEASRPNADPKRCPFVRAVAEGRIEAARLLAIQGPEPAEPAVVDVLVSWAQRAAAGLPVP